MNNMSNNLSKSWINYDEQVTNTIPTQPKTTKTSSKASKSDKPKRKQVKNACGKDD
jgi:hypothetical protein